MDIVSLKRERSALEDELKKIIKDIETAMLDRANIKYVEQTYAKLVAIFERFRDVNEKCIKLSSTRDVRDGFAVRFKRSEIDFMECKSHVAQWIQNIKEQSQQQEPPSQQQDQPPQPHEQLPQRQEQPPQQQESQQEHQAVPQISDYCDTRSLTSSASSSQSRTKEAKLKTVRAKLELLRIAEEKRLHKSA